ncbi:hypothetical protein SBA6_100002 [Candidatus Sulfopaludibacter sp. SbA6]|nr:hypothetical protein SBA6_100002 [Candidatus Sulfopaludibacter sp. SbA6]
METECQDWKPSVSRLETYFVTHTVIGIGSLGKFTIGLPFEKGTVRGPTVLPL